MSSTSSAFVLTKTENFLRYIQRNDDKQFVNFQSIIITYSDTKSYSSAGESRAPWSDRSGGTDNVSGSSFYFADVYYMGRIVKHKLGWAHETE